MIVLSGKLSRKIVGMLFVFFLVALSAIAMTLYLSWQLEGWRRRSTMPAASACAPIAWRT